MARIRILIKVLIALLIYYLVFYITSPIKESDVYEVTGICVDVNMESTLPTRYRSGSTTRTITMNNGEEYIVYRKELKELGLAKDNIKEMRTLIGEKLSFYGKKTYFWDKNEVLGWKSSGTVVDVLKNANKKLAIDRVGLFFIATIVAMLIFLAEILYLWKKHDDRVNERIKMHNKMVRKAKKEKFRERVALEGYQPKKSKQKHRKKR